MALNPPHPGLLLTLGGYFGLLFPTTKFRDRAPGLPFVFGLTGFMGYTLGPILNAHLALPNGGQMMMTAMGATGAIFLGLPAYALSKYPPAKPEALFSFVSRSKRQLRSRKRLLEPPKGGRVVTLH